MSKPSKITKNATYVIGVDYGTDSVRTLLLNTLNGKEVANSVFTYPRWKAGKYCNPKKSQFRQHPQDYIDGLIFTINDVLKNAPKNAASKIIGISIDTTGSTPAPVDSNGTPLALLPEFSKNPNAMFVLWKDHTALKEADEINFFVKNWGGTDYTKYEGGTYSSEWFWAKILHIYRTDITIKAASHSWLEHCDWMPALLTGARGALNIKRSRCAAGHKGMWHKSWNGWPSEEFFSKLDSNLIGLVNTFDKSTYTSDEVAGTLCKEWADKLGLSTNVKIGVGALDAHFGAVGGEIKPNRLSKVMGTSTCDMIVTPKEVLGDKLVGGICGQVDGSIIPGMIGLEAGQSAFGDVYAWFIDLLMWPTKHIISKSKKIDDTTKIIIGNELQENLLNELSIKAEKIKPEDSSILAIDWLNGRRTPDANQLLKGAITGLNLGSDAPLIFRGLVEATVFGTKAIIERFASEGIKIDGVTAMGGVSKKSKLVMQIVADVLNMPIEIAASDQTCALGAGIFAATMSGCYASVSDAQKAMGSGINKVYYPNARNFETYKKLYKKYKSLGLFIETKL